MMTAVTGARVADDAPEEPRSAGSSAAAENAPLSTDEPKDGPAEDGPAEDGPADDGVEEDEELFTIDELASLTGVPSRTIRYYQSKGTLPGPERRGRVAYYRPEHVARLKVIAELQDRGLRLDAIRDALQQIEHGGDSLHTWLGVGDRLQAPWSDDHPMVLTQIELEERIGGHRPGLVSELCRVGVIERQGNARPASYVVPSPGLLDIGLQLEIAGIDAITGWEAGDIMRRRMSRMADELVTFFSERAGQGFGGDGEADDIARSFEALRPEGMRAVQLIFAQEMERALRAFVEAGGAIPSKRSKPADSRSARKPGPRKSSTARAEPRERERKTDRRAERHERRPRSSE